MYFRTVKSRFFNLFPILGGYDIPEWSVSNISCMMPVLVFGGLHCDPYDIEISKRLFGSAVEMYASEEMSITAIMRTNVFFFVTLFLSRFLNNLVHQLVLSRGSERYMFRMRHLYLMCLAAFDFLMRYINAGILRLEHDDEIFYSPETAIFTAFVYLDMSLQLGGNVNTACDVIRKDLCIEVQSSTLWRSRKLTFKGFMS